MLQGYTMAIVPCGNPTPKKLPTGGGEWPTFRTAHAQRTVRPHRDPIQRSEAVGNERKRSGSSTSPPPVVVELTNAPRVLRPTNKRRARKPCGIRMMQLRTDGPPGLSAGFGRRAHRAFMQMCGGILRGMRVSGLYVGWVCCAAGGLTPGVLLRLTERAYLKWLRVLRRSAMTRHCSRICWALVSSVTALKRSEALR